MFYTRVYEVEYLDLYKASLSVNNIAENLFSRADEEGNRFVLFDEIMDHRVDGTDTMHQDASVVSNNGGKRRRETTKGWEIDSVERWIKNMGGN